MSTLDRVEVSRADAINVIANASNDILRNEPRQSYFTIDTAFASSPNPNWNWFTSKMRPLSAIAREVSKKTDPHRFARFVLIRDPLDQPNYWERLKYRRSIQATLHLHLWHGVVLYVAFVSDRRITNIARSIDFGAVGGHAVFDTSSFYEPDFSGFSRLEGAAARAHVKHALSTVGRLSGSDLVKLYYDDRTFSKQRREDAPWKQLRKFLIRLYGSECQGVCSDRRNAPQDLEIDHILPLGTSNNVLTNLRPLCRRCNRQKGSRNMGELPFWAAFHEIPHDIATRETRRIMGDKVPGWLGRYGGAPKGMATYIPYV